MYDMGGKKKVGVGGKKGYIYSSSGDFLVQHVSFVGQRRENGLAFILQDHQAPHE